MTQIIYRASLDTRHFGFAAFAETKETAEAALWDGMVTHEKHYQLARGQMRREYWDDCVIEPIELGVLYRDNEALK